MDELQIAVEKGLKTAKEAGISLEQANQFLQSGYLPYSWQWKFHAAAREADKKDGPVQIGIGGARGPGKSHAMFSQIALDDCQRQPNLKALFLRQTGKAAKESMEDLILRVLAGRISYEHTQSVLRFPNGSKVILGGFQNEKDIDKYVGIEYDVVGIEEENQLSEQKVEMLRGSLRTSKTDWRPRLYASFNPGGIGHGYVKSTFIEPYRSGIERGTRFIPATYLDNPNLNQEYIQYLEGLQGQLGKAWREGDFNILAGQYFTEFNEKLHIVEPFQIQIQWRKYAALDYGYDAPSALYWLAVSPEAQVYVYRELYQTGLTYSRLAEEFVSRTPQDEKIEYLVADPSIWNRDGKDEFGLSGAEIFERRYKEITGHGIRMERGNNDRLQGWAVVREYLRPYQTKDPKTGKEKITAKLQIFQNCTELIRTIPLQVHDERNPEDLECFIAGTPVDTLYGVKPIETLAVGDLVKTPIGLRPVIRAGISGHADRVVSITVSDGRVLRGTFNHQIYIRGKGLVEMQYCKPGDILMEKISISYLWTIKTLFVSIGRLFTKVLSILVVPVVNTLNRMVAILNVVIQLYIAKFISITMALFQLVGTSIISTITATIMIRPTLRPFLGSGTLSTITIFKNQSKSTFATFGNDLIMVAQHYEQMRTKCMPTVHFDNYRAEIVSLLLKLDILESSIVRLANTLGDFIKPLVPFVLERFCKSVMVYVLPKPVHIVAVGNYGNEQVYRLTVKDAHLFYANGFLVTNTDVEDHGPDAVRYGLMSRPTPTKRIPEGLFNHPKQPEINPAF